MTSVYQENGHVYSDNGNNHQENIEINPIEQQFKSWRQKLTAILNEMRLGKNLDSLVNVTVREVREKIQCDRTIIYRFNSLDSGIVIAESRGAEWTPALSETLPAIIYGGATSQEYLEAVVINDFNQIELTPYQKQLLDKFQVKASLSLPIVVEGEVWGLLVVNNCSTPYQWQESEISLLSQVTTEITYRLQSSELERKLEHQEKEYKSVGKVISKIQRASNLEKIFQTTTQELRQLLQCDRVAVYRFHPDWSGEFVAESVGNDWVKLVEPGVKTVWEDTHLQETKGGRYRYNETFVVNDIYQMNHAPCHIDVLEQFEVKAYIIVPVFSGAKLWGLLAAYQNSGTRDWQEWEVNLLNQFGVNFGVAVSQTEYILQTQQQSQQLVRTAERQQNLITLTRKIGEALSEKLANSSQFDLILQTTVQQIRYLLQVDRVVVYRFNPDWSGEFVAESVTKGWTPFREQIFEKTTLEANSDCSIKSLTGVSKVQDTYLQDTKGGRYQQKTSCVVDDIYKAGFPSCYLELLEQFEAKAYLTVPIFQGNKLWGLLASYQNSAPRHWEEFEVNVMQQIAVLLGIAMQQAETLEKLQVKSKELEQAAQQKQLVSKVIERIRESSDIDTLFRSTAQEVRRLLQSDRVGVFRFLIESGSYDEGEFVAEDVLPGFGSVVKGRVKDHCFGTQYASSYREGRIQAIADIYNANLTDCHLEILAKLHIRANLIVPLIKGNELWGLLCIHQCSAAREWQEQEISLVKQIADQFGVALQQAEYLQQLQAQSKQLAEAAIREKADKELLQKGAIQLLAAVRPALNGDLTVRAPITEDELGTIADAYNNTLQALREIVIQVQLAAQQVAETSNSSNTTLTQLTTSAQEQSEEIIEALGELQKMVDSTQAVASSAELVQVAVKSANQTVESGDAAMNLTVEAIQGIRETVAQTSKKIKRLSESSQKISKVVNLIGNFATQTNVLALNAAIEATRAGEYGKGFAVVADEVRSLSRQSAAATIEIEKLVQEIQAETGEVAVAMETGIQQVVEGTNLVNQTRQNLNAIVTATAEISKLLECITAATQTQMVQSVSVTTSMNDVAELANKTFASSNKIADVFQQSSSMAQELLASASKFKVK